MSTMKSAAIAMIREGLPVFFGCDVGKESDSARGLMVKGLLDYETGFGLHDEIERMGKEGRVRVGESAMVSFISSSRSGWAATGSQMEKMVGIGG